MVVTTLPVDSAADGDVVRVALDSSAQAPRQARHLAKAVLLEWALPALVDAVVLVVSELVTNAVRHGRPPVHLVLRRTQQDVSVDVHDGDPGEPPAHPVPAAQSAESGRGMSIVEALGEVRYDQCPDDGKVVHVEFSITS